MGEDKSDMSEKPYQSVLASRTGKILTGLAVGGLAVGLAAALFRRAYRGSSEEVPLASPLGTPGSSAHHSADEAQKLVESSDLLVRFESEPADETPAAPPPPPEELDPAEEDPETSKAVDWVTDVGLQRMLMVHNMKLNRSLKLGQPQPAEDPVARQLEEAVQAQMRKAHWDIFQAELRQGQTSRLVGEIEAIRTLLLEIDPAPQHRTLLEANLDTQLIAQMVSHQAFSTEQFSRLLVFMIDQIKTYDCAENDLPNGEFVSQMQSKLSEHSLLALLPELITYLVDKLNQIKIDKANIFMEWLRPVVERQGVEIERDYMNDLINKGEMALTVTRRWITEHSVPSDGDHKVRMALRRGVMGLLSSDTPATQSSDFPESLMLDRTTIEMLQNQLQLVVLVAAGLIEIKNLIEAQSYYRHLNGDEIATRVQIKPEEVVTLRDAMTQTLSSEHLPCERLEIVAKRFAKHLLLQREVHVTDEEAFLDKVAFRSTAFVDPANKVVPLVKRRLEDRFGAALVAAENQNVSEVLRSDNFAFKCLGIFDHHINQIFQRTIDICDLNLAVFYPRYRDMLK